MSAGRVPAGIAAGPVGEWLEARGAGLRGPFTYELIAGGHSNLTYSVTDAAGNRRVLRRPPLGHVLATAHDMGREYRILAALGGGRTGVPVPGVLGLCEDDSVNGAPFYVMDHVDGHVVRSRAEALTMLDGPRARRRAGEQLADVLAAIHAVDVDRVGLGGLGRREAYAQRQLRRWHRQWDAVRIDGLDVVDEVYEMLAASVPEQRDATLVHADFRLDNCVLGPDGTVRAVLDWELCTLGDPLADVGTTLMFWVEPGESGDLTPSDGTAGDGFIGRDAFCARYAERSGRDLGGIAWYRAFAAWRLACILAGVQSRYEAGAMGAQAGRFTPAHVDGLAREARETLKGTT